MAVVVVGPAMLVTHRAEVGARVFRRYRVECRLGGAAAQVGGSRFVGVASVVDCLVVYEAILRGRVGAHACRAAGRDVAEVDLALGRFGRGARWRCCRDSLAGLERLVGTKLMLFIYFV